MLGSPPPENGAAGRIAFKTGTSYGYRDAWSIGFDGKHTIGVWVGRPDGAPVPGLVGRTAAAPILFDAFARIGGAASRIAARAGGRAGGIERQTATAAAAISARPSCRPNGAAAAAHYLPARRRPARSASTNGKPDPVAAEGGRRRRAADRSGQRRSGCRCRTRQPVLQSRRPRLFARDGDGCRGLNRQCRGAGRG